MRLITLCHTGLAALPHENIHIDGQLTLVDSFNEAEGFQKPDSTEPASNEITISSYRRSKSKSKRKENLDELPARIFEHRLSEEELADKYPNGYRELPDEVYKRLHIIPKTFIVDEHHVHVYSSKDNDGTITQAERPTDLFHNNIETPSLVASMINGKYVNALPLERQSKSYMWVYRNRKMRGTYPIVLFDWQSSRKSDHPRDFLKNFSGTVVTDGYQVYHKIATERQDLKVAECFIHAKRPFAEIIKSVGASKGTVAQEAYDWITEILHIDNDFDDLSDGERKKQRQTKFSPKVDAYFEWVKHKYTQVCHSSAIGKALAYSINQEQSLRAFLSDSNVPPDNNYTEQAIRPIYHWPQELQLHGDRPWCKSQCHDLQHRGKCQCI